MDPSRWERVKAVFQEAFERAPADLPGFLDEACGGDIELRVEAERLLSAHVRAGGFLEGDPTPLPPRIGPYRVLRELGRGGMGTVYLAERDEPGLRKTVAVKLVRPGMASDVVLRRFQTERQILSALEHPGIARLYDGGTTEAGLPYFVMEHVDGLSLLAYCDGRRLGVADRLQLFRRVCEAVQFAHQSLVVHRDLKPSNILVTAEGDPKLLDFGIAKLTAPAASAMTTDETATVARFLSPRYASPEQIRGERVTTASDIYSLGVILYELLTGRRPYEPAGPGAAGVERNVLAAEPDRPSTAVARAPHVPPGEGSDTQTITPALLSARRATTPEKLRRRLRGDLDNIVLRALRKEPAQRYPTAAELADDLGRHLSGFPVRAQPDRLGYRTAKFVRRHGAAVAATTVVVLSVAVGVGVALWEARVARAERDRARAEAAKAEQVSKFLTSIFEAAGPDTHTVKPNLQGLLERGTARIDELQGQPEVQAALLLTMGKVYDSLDLRPQALAVAERSVALRLRVFGTDSLETAESLDELGRMQRKTAAYDAARHSLEQALAIREKVLGRDHPLVAASLDALAGVHWYQGDYDRTAALMERAVTILQAATPDSIELDRILGNLGLLYEATGEMDRARAVYEKMRAHSERIGGPEGPNVVFALLGLGGILVRDERPAEAGPYLDQALAVMLRTYGEKHSNTALVLTQLGEMHLAKGDLAGAESFLTRAIRALEDTVGPRHPDLAPALSGYGRLLVASGQAQRALEPLERALAIREAALGAEHPLVAESLVDLARARQALHGPAAAEPLLRRAVAINARSLKAGHRYRVPGLVALAQVLRDTGKGAEARPLVEEAVAIARATMPARHSLRLQAEKQLRES